MKLPLITPKQNEILFQLYKFRFLNTHQFQNLFNHKDPHRIKEWLKDLTDKTYIARNYSRKTIRESTTPAIYYLAPKARHILKTNEKCDPSILNKIYKEKKRTNKFIQHCLTIANLYLYFLSQNKPNDTLRFFTGNEISKYDYFPDPKPSAYISVKTSDHTRRYFLDVFDPYTPSSVLRHYVRKYLDYAKNGEWEEKTNGEPLPAVLFVCPNERTKKHIYFYTKAIFEKAFEEKINLFLTTIETIQRNNKNVWEKVSLNDE